MYLNGHGVERNLARGAELYRKVCDGGDAEICNALGELYDEVPGFEVSPKQIAELYEKACNGNSMAGCVNLGLFYASAGDPEAGARLYDRACASGLPAGCHYLAAAYEIGEGVTANLPRAVELYDEACSTDYVDSCLALANLYTEGTAVVPDPVRAASYNKKALAVYEAGCEAGNLRECAARDRLKTRLQIMNVRPPGSTPPGL